jgi:hypothetical protein
MHEAPIFPSFFALFAFVVKIPASLLAKFLDITTY